MNESVRFLIVIAALFVLAPTKRGISGEPDASRGPTDVPGSSTAPLELQVPLHRSLERELKRAQRRIRSLESELRKLQAHEMKLFSVGSADAESVVKILQSLYRDLIDVKDLRVTFDKRSNKVLASGSAQLMTEFEALIPRLAAIEAKQERHLPK